MNAPYDRALLNADCTQRSTAPVDAANVLPDSVRASSRPLGWKPLNIERRELEPGGDCLPGGVTEHLYSSAWRTAMLSVRAAAASRRRISMPAWCPFTRVTRRCAGRGTPGCRSR